MPDRQVRQTHGTDRVRAAHPDTVLLWCRTHSALLLVPDWEVSQRKRRHLVYTGHDELVMITQNLVDLFKRMDETGHRNLAIWPAEYAAPILLRRHMRPQKWPRPGPGEPTPG